MERKTINFPDNMFKCIQIFRSVFFTSKNKKLKNMSFSDAVRLLLLIALNSKINPKDPRMDAINDFLNRRKIYIDKRRIEDLGRQVLSGLKW